MTSVIQDAIILVLDQHNGELQGTETLAEMINMVNAKSYVLRRARVMQSNGTITIIPSRGGRGHKSVYRRNRNSAGCARKVRP